MLYGDPGKRTGRENRVVFVCRACSHRTDPKPWPLQEISVDGSKCGSCTSLWNVQFVAYEDGVENDDAERALAGVLTKEGPGSGPFEAERYLAMREREIPNYAEDRVNLAIQKIIERCSGVPPECPE